MPPVELTDGVKACIEMAEAALGVKNIALDTLSNEYDTLKKENSQLVNLATAKGGDQVPLLMQRLAQARLEAHHAQLESVQLRCRLYEETELRQDLERELEDTAAAAQELWESMQAVYSEAADSRAPSRAGSHASEGWGTPPGASSPTSSPARATPQQQQQQRPQTPLQQGIAAAAAAALAAAAAAAEQQQRGTAGSRPATPARLSLLGTPEGAAAAAAGDDGVPVEGLGSAVTAAAGAAVGLSVPMTGILTPLEDKLQSLSSKLVGLVSWLDTRDATSPGSTPRSSSTAAPSRYSTPRLATAAASPAGAAAAAGSNGVRLGLLPLGSPVSGSGPVYSVAAALDAAAGIDSPGSSVKGADAASIAKRRPSPRVGMATSLAAAAGAAGDVDVAAGNGAAAAGSDIGANRAVDVCRVKDS